MICSCGALTKPNHYRTKDKVEHWISRCPACGRRHEVKKDEDTIENPKEYWSALLHEIKSWEDIEESDIEEPEIIL